VSVRLALNRDVLDALVSRPNPDPYRVLHHAVQAGDDAAVVTFGQRAARDASRSGAHRQAAACCAEVIPRAQHLPSERLASLNESYSNALSNSNQLHSAAHAAAVAVEHSEKVGSGGKLVRGLVTLTRQLWLTEQTDAARSSAEHALALAEPLGATVDHAFALLGVGGYRVLVDDEVGGVPLLADAVRLAERLGADDIVALSRNYLGSALLQLGDDSGREALLDSVDVAAREGRHEYVMRGYYNLMEGLWRLGCYEEALSFVDLAEDYGRDRDFPVYAYMVDARRYRWMAMHGH